MRRFLCVLISLVALRAEIIAAPSAATLQTGEIDGAFYAIAAPDSRAWNGNLLLIAHGYRPETAPLVADLNPNQSAYQSLLADGWIVAMTSYRRNGIIIADAISDLNALRDRVLTLHGPAQKVIVMGDSMGGTIATLLAEAEEPGFDGFIAIGPALDLKENDGAKGVSIKPRHPLLFLANRSEIDGPSSYLRGVMDLPADPSLSKPVLFRVERDGHVNVNQDERLLVIRSMQAWLTRGRDALPPTSPAKPFDATRAPLPQPSAVVFDDDHRGFVATVTEVSSIYGNVWLNAQPADFESIGLVNGLWAQLKVRDNTFRVRHGRDFDDVERGQWVTFPNADGFYWLSRNWANAAETADLKEGDTVHLRRFDEATKP